LKLTHGRGGCAISTATLTLFRFSGLAARLWVLAQMALARPALRRESDLSFVKLCGSGTGEGFTPRPNWQVWAILAVWNTEEAARRGIAQSPVWQRWRARAAEDWTLFLQPASGRGTWSGTNPFVPQVPPVQAVDGQPLQAQPLVALTRATLRLPHALRFWRRVPDISAAIGADANVVFKIGIGEVPLLHQVTISVWPDSASMAAFARAEGPHARAIRAVRAGDWFAEELYARFRLIGTAGRWRDAGQSTLDQRTAA
jgi:spheroidene monooxygenase